jgi:hypothetical protein
MHLMSLVVALAVIPSFFSKASPFDPAALTAEEIAQPPQRKESLQKQRQLHKALPQTIVIRISNKNPNHVDVLHSWKALQGDGKLVENSAFVPMSLSDKVTMPAKKIKELDQDLSTSSFGFWFPWATYWYRPTYNYCGYRYWYYPYYRTYTRFYTYAYTRWAPGCGYSFHYGCGGGWGSLYRRWYGWY